MKIAAPAISKVAFIAIVGACILGICCKSSETAANTVADSPTIEEIAKTYKSLPLMTGEPRNIPDDLFTNCSGFSDSYIVELRQQFGPHAFASINIYMNDAAASHFSKQKNSYSTGSIIIKEKVISGATFEEMKARQAGVGGMIKRAPGYDPEHGDWEYFYFENPAKITSGRIANCVQCHTNAKDRDYVFGGWAEQR